MRLLAAVLGELVEQIAVGAVNLDAVEAGGDRILRAALEVVDDAGKLGQLQRARLGNIGEGVVDKGLALGADRCYGATGLPPPGCSESCEIRPTCQIWMKMRPPRSCTRSVTLRQPATCSFE